MSSTSDFPLKFGQKPDPKPNPCEILRSVTTPHFFVAGQSGSGKNLRLYDVIRRALDPDDGVTVTDPHGNLVENQNACMTSDCPENIS